MEMNEARKGDLDNQGRETEAAGTGILVPGTDLLPFKKLIAGRSLVLYGALGRVVFVVSAWS
jgi:hypothetical protein